MRAILILVAAGCGGGEGGPDPHEVVPCEISQHATCERACVGIAPAFGEPTCQVQFPGALTTDSCGPIVTFDGIDGCCLFMPGAGYAFWECE